MAQHVGAENSWGAPEEASASQSWGTQDNAVQSAKACENSLGASNGDLPGLPEWLTGLSLQKYGPQASGWCAEMGAVSIEEVEENWEDFADAMKLKPLERKRLAK